MTNAQHTHTPGPLFLRDNGPSDRLVAGDDRATIATGIVNRLDTQLLAAAYTSYDKHFGPNAIAAAEADLLGQLVASVSWFVEFCDEHPEWTDEQFGDDTAEGEWLETLRALLAKAGRVA